MVDRRWLGWGLLAAGFLFVSFHRVSTAVIAEDLARVFQTTATELGVLHASFFYVYAALQLPAGVLVDRLGPRRVATGGLTIMGLGVIGFALSPTYAVGFLARMLVGLGGSVLYVSTLRFCANWFRPDQFATMNGWTTAAAGLGGILATTPLAVAVGAFGWRTAVTAGGVLVLLLAVSIGAFVRDSPDGAGQPPIEGVAQVERTASFAAMAANARSVLRQSATWVMGLLLFLVIGANVTVLGLWGVPFLVDRYGLTVAHASGYVLVGNLGFLLGPPVLGWLSDRLGTRTDLVLASVVWFTLAYGLIALVGTPPLALVGVALFAAVFANGGVALAYPLAKDRHAEDASGTATGTINSMGYFGAAVIPGVMGIALDAYWTGEIVAGARVYTAIGYRVAFGVAAVSGLIAIVCAVWLHRHVD